MLDRRLRIPLLRLVFIPVIFVAVFVRPSWNLESTTAFVVEGIGYVFLLIGLIIRIWCTFYIGGRKNIELITTGPYSICRNPLYIGTFILSIGIGLCFENLLIILIALVIIIPVHTIVIKMEETHLETVFGEQYRMYKQKVSRFWPHLSNYSSPDVLQVNVHAIWKITIDAVGVLLLPEIEDLLELLHSQGIIPVLWHL